MEEIEVPIEAPVMRLPDDVIRPILLHAWSDGFSEDLTHLSKNLQFSTWPCSAVASAIRQHVSVQAALNLACRRGNVPLVRHMLSATRPQAVANWGRSGSALWYAAKHGHVEVCRLLLSQKDNPSRADCFGSTALQAAAQGGHVEVCELLTTWPEHPAKPSDGQSNSLRLAAARGCLDLCRLLLDCPHDPADALESNALTEAAAGGFEDVVNLLLSRGAIPTDSAVFQASKHGHVDIVKLLLERGHFNTSLFHALSIAASQGHAPVCALLMDKPDLLKGAHQAVVYQDAFSDAWMREQTRFWRPLLDNVTELAKVRGLSDQELIDIIRRDDMFSFSKRMDQLLALARGETLPPPLPTFPGSGAAGSSSSGPFMYRPRPLPGPSEVRFGSTGARHMWSPSPLGLRTKRERRNVPYGPPPAPFMDFPEPEDPMLD